MRIGKRKISPITNSAAVPGVSRAVGGQWCTVGGGYGGSRRRARRGVSMAELDGGVSHMGRGYDDEWVLLWVGDGMLDVW